MPPWAERNGMVADMVAEGAVTSEGRVLVLRACKVVELEEEQRREGKGGQASPTQVCLRRGRTSARSCKFSYLRVVISILFSRRGTTFVERSQGPAMTRTNGMLTHIQLQFLQ